jgi:hypothetical protein
LRGTDWLAWHRQYQDPDSRFPRRLAALQRQLRPVLDRAPPGPITVVSPCAGQGDDLLGVLAEHPRRHDVVARLIELDPRNAEIARSIARELGLAGISVLEADAGLSDAYLGAVPASLVILAGFFSYLDEADLARTVASLPQLCAGGAIVVWARGRARSNTRSQIRSLFQRAGFVEIACEDVERPELHVGVERFAGVPAPLEPGRRIFTFREPGVRRRSRLLRALGRLWRQAGGTKTGEVRPQSPSNTSSSSGRRARGASSRTRSASGSESGLPR